MTSKIINLRIRFKLILMLVFVFVSSFIIRAQNTSTERSAVVGKAKPNIIFLFADDLGWGDLSCYGGSRVTTPSLDKLAGEGTLFTQFYVAGSVCSPSRSGIMSGQFPARNRIFGHFATEERNEQRGMPNALNPDLNMLTDIFKEAGYTTAHFGKWHLGNISPAEYGVDVFRTDLASNLNNDHMDIWSPGVRPTCTKDILDETLKFIAQQGEKPFYANVWFSDVHATLNPSKEQMDRVLTETNWLMPPEEVKYTSVEQVYLAALLEMDKQIGLFLDKLEEMELYNILIDPSEVNNLARQKSKLVKKLTEKAMTWFNGLPESPWDETAGQNAWSWPQ